MKKILFIVIDGLGDKPIPQLGYMTPLAAAKTPNLDWLCKSGMCGLLEPFQFPWQEYPASDTTHLALFGYNPQEYYLGRGPYEVAGIGMKIKKGDVALRVNFATVDENLKVIDRRAGRIRETQFLIKALQGIEIQGVKFLIKKSYGHRAGLILRGKNLSAEVSDGDPHQVGVNIKEIIPRNKEAKFTAKILNLYLEKVHQILKNHPVNKKRKLPANYLLIRGAGKMQETPSFKKKYGFRAACIAGGGLYKGIGKVLGMNLIKARGATGLPNTNLKGKFIAAKKSLKKYDFIFLHIKATDSLAEDGNFFKKKEFIEKIDKNLKSLLGLKNILIVITADHSTCCALKRHCSEPIPLLIYGKGSDNIEMFSEKACKMGKLGKIKQLQLTPLLMIMSNERPGPDKL